MATESVPMGDPAPQDLKQKADEVLPKGYHRPYVGGPLLEDVEEGAPLGTPVVGATDGPFEADGLIPRGANQPLTAEQAAYLNNKYPEPPEGTPLPGQMQSEKHVASGMGTVTPASLRSKVKSYMGR